MEAISNNLSQISIHAPHAGSDTKLSATYFSHSISIHAPHAGSDLAFFPIGQQIYNFNPRPPCGERPSRQPRGSRRRNFNPRPPCGERLNFSKGKVNSKCISIHAPHAGSDRIRILRLRCRPYFNPRPPCGERPTIGSRRATFASFQSTPPMRGATKYWPVAMIALFISIHAPHAGSDFRALPASCPQYHFNPRPPCGERPPPSYSLSKNALFQSTPPMRGATG